MSIPRCTSDQLKNLRDIFEFLINSESYKTLEKVAVTDVEYGDIKISDIDTYKELMYTGLEKKSRGLVEEAIQLIPSLPYAFMAMATVMDNDVDKYKCKYNDSDKYKVKRREEANT